jgi:hypothetical protein
MYVVPSVAHRLRRGGLWITGGLSATELLGSTTAKG